MHVLQDLVGFNRKRFLIPPQNWCTFLYYLVVVMSCHLNEAFVNNWLSCFSFFCRFLVFILYANLLISARYYNSFTPWTVSIVHLLARFSSILCFTVGRGVTKKPSENYLTLQLLWKIMVICKSKVSDWILIEKCTKISFFIP